MTRGIGDTGDLPCGHIHSLAAHPGTLSRMDNPREPSAFLLDIFAPYAKFHTVPASPTYPGVPVIVPLSPCPEPPSAGGTEAPAGSLLAGDANSDRYRAETSKKAFGPIVATYGCHVSSGAPPPSGMR